MRAGLIGLEIRLPLGHPRRELLPSKQSFPKLFMGESLEISARLSPFFLASLSNRAILAVFTR